MPGDRVGNSEIVCMTNKNPKAFVMAESWTNIKTFKAMWSPSFSGVGRIQNNYFRAGGMYWMRHKVELSIVEALVCRYERVECIGAKMVDGEFCLGDQFAPETNLEGWVDGT